MLLCDIGNSAAKFYDDGRVFSLKIDEFLNYSAKKKIYYINVNERVKFKLKNSKNFINLEPYFNIDSQYKGMGIDRIVACLGVESGVVVDAGSAISVDVMENGSHLGGFLMAGISSMLEIYAQISPRLKIVFNSQIDLKRLPQKTQDALTYGIVRPVILAIEEIAKDRKIFFTGGDGHYFSQFFTNTIYDRDLIFRSMVKLIKENKDIL